VNTTDIHFCHIQLGTIGERAFGDRIRVKEWMRKAQVVKGDIFPSLVCGLAGKN